MGYTGGVGRVSGWVGVWRLRRRISRSLIDLSSCLPTPQSIQSSVPKAIKAEHEVKARAPGTRQLGEKKRRKHDFHFSHLFLPVLPLIHTSIPHLSALCFLLSLSSIQLSIFVPGSTLSLETFSAVVWGECQSCAVRSVWLSRSVWGGVRVGVGGVCAHTPASMKMSPRCAH